MEYRRLGKSGLKVSALSYGSWVTFGTQVDTKAATELMAYAYEAGINFFDNAEVYAGGKSEEIMGQVIKKLGWQRDSYIISSKVFWGGDKPTQKGLHRKHIVDACHSALKRFQTDYLDLYFCHRPDPETPIEETVLAMNTLIQQGKILYWGTSEWSAEQIEYAHNFARQNFLLSPTMEQPEYHMFKRERVEVEYKNLYETMGLGTTIWSPLASGILTGKYLKGIPEGSRLSLPQYEWLKERVFTRAEHEKSRIERLQSIASSLHVSLAQLAIAWCLKNKNVSTVILGASQLNQLKENLQALDLISMIDVNVMENIEDILHNS